MNEDELNAEDERRVVEAERATAYRATSAYLQVAVSHLEKAHARAGLLPSRLRAQIERVLGDTTDLVDKVEEDRWQTILSQESTTDVARSGVAASHDAPGTNRPNP